MPQSAPCQASFRKERLKKALVIKHFRFKREKLNTLVLVKKFGFFWGEKFGLFLFYFLLSQKVMESKKFPKLIISYLALERDCKCLSNSSFVFLFLGCHQLSWTSNLAFFFLFSSLSGRIWTPEKWAFDISWPNWVLK